MAWNWGISIITFAFGLGIGFLAAYLVIPRSGRIHELERDLESAQAEHRAYRDKVGQHFQKTAELFEDMTERYRAVYRHMAGSAQALCEQQPAALQLDPAGRARPPEQVAAPAARADAATTETGDAAARPRDIARAADADDEDQAFGDAPRIPELTEEFPAGDRPEAPPAAAESR
jgi:uncharacterized membrane-anchored protein YhcB (DUF1043 family)